MQIHNKNTFLFRDDSVPGAQDWLQQHIEGMRYFSISLDVTLDS